jgi:regulator of sigma E protease
MVKLFSYKGTDYTLNWLPLGGFVRPLGEDMVRQLGDDATNVDREEAERRGVGRTMSVNEAPPLGRIFFMAAGAMANFLMAFILFVVIALSGLPQQVGAAIGLNFVAEGSVLAQAGLQQGDAIQTINGESFTSADALIEQIYASNGEPVTLRILRQNEAEPVEITFTPDLMGAPAPGESHPIVLGIAEDSPAEAAGLEAIDLILAFNGEAVADYQQLQELTAQHLDEAVTLTVWRDGEEIDLTLTPRSQPPAGQGAMGIGIATATLNPDMGVIFQEGARNELVPQPLDRAVAYSVGRITEVMRTIASIPGQILSGTAESDSLRFTSPLGISQVGGVFLQESIQRDQPSIIIEFIALISLALGLTNLLPIPALDGGRILFVVVEMIRGRPISPEREGMVHLVGLALLLSLMVVVLINDIANPLTNLLR